MALLAHGEGFQSIYPSLIVATIGNSLGGISCYILGRMGKWQWLEKFFKIKKETIYSYRERLERFSGWPALLCWLPIVGDPIAVSFGFFKMPFLSFFIFMTIGKFARYLFLIYIVQ